MKYLIIKLFIVFAIVFSPEVFRGQIPSKPSDEKLVNDFADILTPEQEKKLEDSLESFAVNTSNQIAVVTVRDLNGMDPNQFAFEILDKWGIGKKGKDNGVVMLIKPKQGKNDRGYIAIQVGYGLEGAIPDATTKMIIEKIMIPYFKQGEIYDGIFKGVEAIEKLAIGEFNKKDFVKKDKPINWSAVITLLVLLLIFFLSGKKGGGRGGRGMRNFIFFTGGTSFSDFSGGNGSFGGGFGGFGGGTGGGGGASGSW